MKMLDDLVEGLNNINVSKWMAGVPFPYTKKDAKSFIEIAKNQDEKVKIYLAIILKENNKVIGGTELKYKQKRWNGWWVYGLNRKNIKKWDMVQKLFLLE